MIRGIVAFLAAVARLWQQRDAAANAQDVKAAKKANNENASVEAETKAVQDEDEDAIRRNISE